MERERKNLHCLALRRRGRCQRAGGHTYCSRTRWCWTAGATTTGDAPVLGRADYIMALALTQRTHVHEIFLSARATCRDGDLRVDAARRLAAAGPLPRRGRRSIRSRRLVLDSVDLNARQLEGRDHRRRHGRMPRIDYLVSGHRRPLLRRPSIGNALDIKTSSSAFQILSPATSTDARPPVDARPRTHRPAASTAATAPRRQRVQSTSANAPFQAVDQVAGRRPDCPSDDVRVLRDGDHRLPATRVVGVAEEAGVVPDGSGCAVARHAA